MIPRMKSAEDMPKIIAGHKLGHHQCIEKNPTATQKQIAETTNKSERTIKRRTVEMQEKGLICRENGKRNGKWKVVIEL